MHNEGLIRQTLVFLRRAFSFYPHLCYAPTPFYNTSIMNITAELLTRIRLLLNEAIPENGTDKDTHFSDVDLAITIQASESENHTLYLLWTQKAGLIQKDAGCIKSIQAGGERIEKYTIADYVALCLKTAQGYKEAWEAERKSSDVSFLVYGKKEDELW